MRKQQNVSLHCERPDPDDGYRQKCEWKCPRNVSLNRRKGEVFYNAGTKSYSGSCLPISRYSISAVNQVLGKSESH